MSHALTMVPRRAGRADRDSVIALMVASFHRDPVSSWLFPVEETRPEIHRRFFGTFVDMVLEAGTIFLTGHLDGVALWMDVSPTDKSDPALRDALCAAAGEHGDRVATFDSITGAAHPTHEPHAYLLFLAVAPARQGAGIGAALLGHRLADLDRLGSSAYLEASSDRNRRLYERLGFRAGPVGIELPDGPTLASMWRDPARTAVASTGRSDGR